MSDKKVIAVKRNDVELNFNEAEYKREPRKGEVYYAPDVVIPGDDTWKQIAALAPILGWIGKDTLEDWLQAKLNLTSQAATEEASTKLKVGADGKPVKGEDDKYLYEDKPFDVNQFSDFMSKLSTRGESKAELEEQLNELLEQSEKLVGDKSLSPADAMLKFTHIMTEISNVRRAIERKSAGRGRPKAEAAKA